MKELDVLLLRYLEQDYAVGVTRANATHSRGFSTCRTPNSSGILSAAPFLRTTPCAMSSPGSAMTVELPRWPLADRLARRARGRGR